MTPTHHLRRCEYPSCGPCPLNIPLCMDEEHERMNRYVIRHTTGTFRLYGLSITDIIDQVRDVLGLDPATCTYQIDSQ